MGRPIKEGLEYFDLDCQLDDKIKLIQAEFGLKGFAVVVKLFQKIYGGHGYYCEWDEDTILLFMSENGLGSENKPLIEGITRACIRRQLFSAELYEKYRILTSSGIQRRYLNAVSRRESVRLEKAYLLVQVDQSRISVSNNLVFVDRNLENADENTQRRVEKSREENIKTKAAALPRDEAFRMIGEKSFPPELSEALKDWLSYKIEKRQWYKKTGLRSLITQVEEKAKEAGPRAVAEAIRISMSNNYQGIIWDTIRKRQPTGRGTRFNNFPQRDYDFPELEKQLNNIKQ